VGEDRFGPWDMVDGMVGEWKRLRDRTIFRGIVCTLNKGNMEVQEGILMLIGCRNACKGMAGLFHKVVQ